MLNIEFASVRFSTNIPTAINESRIHYIWLNHLSPQYIITVSCRLVNKRKFFLELHYFSLNSFFNFDTFWKYTGSGLVFLQLICFFRILSLCRRYHPFPLCLSYNPLPLCRSDTQLPFSQRMHATYPNPFHNECMRPTETLFTTNACNLPN